MAEVWRGGLSSNGIRMETETIRVSSEPGAKSFEHPVRPSISTGGAHANDKRKGLSISFGIASKGGGTTWVKAWYGSDEFRVLAEAMVRADPEAAKEAFKSAIKNPNRTQEEWKREYYRQELAKLERGSE